MHVGGVNYVQHCQLVLKSAMLINKLCTYAMCAYPKLLSIGKAQIQMGLAISYTLE
jgi:hypothetical protein